MTAVLGASLTLSESTATTATGHLLHCVNSTRRRWETGRQVARAGSAGAGGEQPPLPQRPVSLLHRGCLTGTRCLGRLAGPAALSQLLAPAGLPQTDSISANASLCVAFSCALAEDHRRFPPQEKYRGDARAETGLGPARDGGGAQTGRVAVTCAHDHVRHGQLVGGCRVTRGLSRGPVTTCGWAAVGARPKREGGVADSCRCTAETNTAP